MLFWPRRRRNWEIVQLPQPMFEKYSTGSRLLPLKIFSEPFTTSTARIMSTYEMVL